MEVLSNRMRCFLFIFVSVVVTLISARYYHRLRLIRLENSFCTGYQERKDNKCAARLSTCSKLDPRELNTMRQVLCGFKIDPAVQTEPPKPVPFNGFHYFHGYYGGGGFGIHGFLGGAGYLQGYGPEFGHGHGHGHSYGGHGLEIHGHKKKGAVGYPHPKHFADVFEADVHQYRFIASIYSSDRKYLCGGALVSPRTVITSAQCIPGIVQTQEPIPDEKRKKRQEGEEEQTPEGDGGPPPNGGNLKLMVRFGEQYLNDNPIFHKIYEYDVENYEIHPKYDSVTYQNDIAVLRLVNPVPICLFPPILIPRKFEYWLDFDHIAGCSATYMGWGLNNQRPYFRAQTGQVLPQYFCHKLFNWEPDQLHPSQLCVDSPTGVCITDIGGPLITHNKHGWVLIGIMSFGKHCRTPGLPLVFSRVTDAFDLIWKYIDQDFNSRNYTHVYPDECHHIHGIHPHIGPIDHKYLYPYAGPLEKHGHGHVEGHIDPYHEKEHHYEKPHEEHHHHHHEHLYAGVKEGALHHHNDDNIIHLPLQSVKKQIPEIVLPAINHPISLKDYFDPNVKVENPNKWGGVLPIKHIDYEHLK